jgi:hypothetical protein
LDCWIVGMLECWIVGLLDCWNVGLLLKSNPNMQGRNNNEQSNFETLKLFTVPKNAFELH